MNPAFALFDEKMIRDELRRLDGITGLHGAELPIKFGIARSYLGRFSYRDPEHPEFYFSNYYFRDPNLPTEEKLNVIRHEYAHYMDFMRTGSSSHKSSWRKCCDEIGAYAVRCFSYKHADTIAAINRKNQQANEKYEKYSVGRTIVHPFFGKGEITAVTGDGSDRIATVSFGGATEKKLAISWIDSNCKTV